MIGKQNHPNTFQNQTSIPRRTLSAIVLTLGLLVALPGWAQTSLGDTLFVHKRAQEFHDQAKYDSAQVYFQKASAEYQKLGKLHLYLRSHNELGQVLYTLGAYKRAKQVISDALDQAEQIDIDTQLYVQLLNNLISIHLELEEQDQAVQLLDKVIPLAQAQLGASSLELAVSYHNKGNLYEIKGNYDQAWEYYQKALEIREEQLPPDAPILASTYNSIAIISYYRGKLYKAAEMFLDAGKAVQLKKGEKHPDVAGYFNNAGIVYKELGEFKKAAKYSTQALRIQQELFGKIHPDLSYSYNNLANLHRILGEYDQALRYYQKELAIAKQTQGEDHHDVARTYFAIGQLQLKMRKMDDARASIQKYFDIAKAKYPDGHPEMIKAYRAMYEIHFFQQNWKKAEEYSRKGIAMGKQLESYERVSFALVHRALGQALLEQGRYQESLEALQSSLQILVPSFDNDDVTVNPDLKREHYIREVVTALGSKGIALARYYREQPASEYAQAALETFDLSIEVIDKVQQELRSEESKLQWGIRSREVFERAIKACQILNEETGDPLYLEKAFHYAEKSRSRVIIGQINDSHAKQFAGVPDSLIAQEEELRTVLGDLQLKLASASFQKDSSKVMQYRESLYRYDERLNNHIQFLERAYPEYYKLKYQREVVSATQLQEQILTPDQAMVQYFLGDENQFMFVLDQQNIKLVSQPINKQLKQHVYALRRNIIQQDRDSLALMSKQLYAELIQPVQSYIQDKHSLLIVPDGSMHYLPFEVLLTDDQSSQSYLITNYEISYIPSATLIWQNRNRDEVSERPDRLLAMAPLFLDAINKTYTPEPIRSDSITPLPLTRYEVESIAKEFQNDGGLMSWLWDQPEPSVLLESQATEAYIKSADLSDYKYLHFATHAYIKEEYPNLSGIQFYVDDGPEDGVLLANEVYNLDIDADLVVLSACETGLGKVVEGEGIIGFTRPFLYAGASNLMVSLWKVADRSTAEYMIDFYEHALSGESYTTASRKAKLKMIQSGQFSDPWYWSPFVLIGHP
ncbi:MAG: CHAT domain-containing protein [Bacteroidota bacterium]